MWDFVITVYKFINLDLKNEPPLNYLNSFHINTDFKETESRLRTKFAMLRMRFREGALVSVVMNLGFHKG
jgi:hypothetical protein